MQHEVWYVDVYEGQNSGIIRAEQEVFLQKTSNGILVLPHGSAGKYIPSRWSTLHDITSGSMHPWIELSGKSLQKNPFVKWTDEEKEKYQQLVQRGFIQP